MKLSPEIKYKWSKFKKQKRAYYSLLVLLILFICSLPAELLFNDKPLILNIEGKYFFHRRNRDRGVGYRWNLWRLLESQLI